MAFDSPSRRAFLAGSAVAVGGGAIYYFGQSDGSTAHGLSPRFHASDEESAIGLDLAGKPIMGAADAPITIYYWTDFQCPFCERFERETLPDLVREYVSSGRVRIVFVAVPYFGADSLTAAVASKCAWRQVRDDDPGTYWNWHTRIFEKQGRKNSGWASADRLLAYTRSVSGVDADRLSQCLADRRSTLESQVSADVEFARSIRVRATPTFIVYDPAAETGGRLVGAQPIERFDDAIERVENA